MGNMKNWENKLTKIERRLNIQNSPPKVCVVFQDGKTMPDGVELDKAKMVMRLNLNQNDF
jgi:hypothetical protein